MTAVPPSDQWPVFSDPVYSQHASSYISPASTIPQESNFWAHVSPQEGQTTQRQRKKPPSPTVFEESASDGGLCFIIGGSLDELKSKQNMTRVRKKAMGSFLKDRKSATPSDRSRLNSEASDGSRTGTITGLVADSSTLLSDGSRQKVNRDNPLRSTQSPVAKRSNRKSSPDMQLSHIPKNHGSILPPAPIVLPMRTTVKLPYDEHVPPPLRSIGKSLDPFRTMFQSQHPQISVEELKFHCSRFFGTRGLGRYWIPTCLSYPHTFLSTLCLASSHHDIVYEAPVESLATAALRQEIVHMIGQNLLNPSKSVADHNIVAVTQLIISEVIGREEAGLLWHEAGIGNMIKQRGGLNKLGMDGHLASAISWVSLASAVLREIQPRFMYADYCLSRSSKKYPRTLTIPESPIFRPHDRFVTIQRSSMCKPAALKIISDLWIMIDIFLHEPKSMRRNSQTLLNLYKQITNDYDPISEFAKTNVLTESDWKYEAIRITAIIQATAIIQRIPLSDALIQAAPSCKPALLVTSSIVAQSTESLTCLFDPRHDAPVIENSTSSSYNLLSTGPAIQSDNQPFDSQRPAFSSNQSAFSPQHPPFSTTHSSSSDLLFFPPPPAPAPSGSTSLLRSLKDTLERSDLSDCWADMAGILFWIGLVVGAASRKSDSKILKKYFSATAMRAGIMLCFEHPEAIHSTMLRMGEVVEALDGDKSEVARRDSPSMGKKRRI